MIMSLLRLNESLLIRALAHSHEALEHLKEGRLNEAVEKARKAIVAAPRRRVGRRVLTPEGKLVRQEAQKIIEMARKRGWEEKE